MKPFVRQLFICSAIEQCRETTNCCAHKQPHIKDERCVPRECRFAPGAADIDCVAYPLEKPSVPVPVAPVIAPSAVVTQVLENEVKVTEVTGSPELIEAIKQTIEITEEATQEINIKEAVKKQASSKKKGRKA